MCPTNSACTSGVVVVNQQHDRTVRYLAQRPALAAKPPRKAPKFCTTIENGLVVVRPVHSE